LRGADRGSMRVSDIMARMPLLGGSWVLAPKIGRVGEDALEKAGLKDAGGQLQLSSGTPVHLAHGGGQAFRRRSAKYR
jgi:hypothetical protein